MNFRFALFNW